MVDTHQEGLPLVYARSSRLAGGNDGDCDYQPSANSTSSETATGAVAGFLNSRSPACGATVEEEPQDGAATGVTLFWAGATLAMSTIGTGLLSLPSSFACLGMPTALVLLTGTAWGMYFTGVLLLRCHLSLDGRATTYDELAGHAFGSKGATIVPLVVVVGLFGGSCAYVTLAKELMPALLAWVRLDKDESWLWGAELWTAVLLATISFPLCLARNISSLRYSSSVGCVFSLFLMGLITYRGAIALARGEAKWQPLAEQSLHACPPGYNSIASSSSVFFFSFVFHLNVCPLFRSLCPEQVRALFPV
jgi:amino acid permease